MANGITTLRMLLFFALVALLCAAPTAWQSLNVPILILIFVLDGVDGHVARRRHETTTFGAMYDIAADRIIECVLWIVLMHRGLTPVWVPIVFCTRGVLVDVIRTHAASRGQTPFGMMHTRLGRFLVAGRAMRIGYAVAKAVTFGWLLLILPWREQVPEFWQDWQVPLGWISSGLTYATVALCVARGMPVIADAVVAELISKPRPAQRAPQEQAVTASVTSSNVSLPTAGA
jgi:CDP-diacylglycerol--glycerol-3-phosphate 3-phosphatidyltransferase